MVKEQNGAHQYDNIDQNRIDEMIEALKENGATVSGENPWLIDTHKKDVKLKGHWNQADSTLTVSITDKSWYVPDSKIWEVIDPLLNQL